MRILTYLSLKLRRGIAHLLFVSLAAVAVMVIFPVIFLAVWILPEDDALAIRKVIYEDKH